MFFYLVPVNNVCTKCKIFQSKYQILKPISFEFNVDEFFFNNSSLSKLIHSLTV